jgi:VanZ family protein
MALIFFLSHQPDLSSGLGLFDLIGRKFVHAGIFGLLFLLWWRAFRSRAVLTAAVIAFAYAVSDEIHQSFIEGRHGSAVDVAIDSAGIAAGALLVRRRER